MPADRCCVCISGATIFPKWWPSPNRSRLHGCHRRRRVLRTVAPGQVRMASHLQDAFTSRHDIGVCKPRLIPWLAIERSGLYVFVLCGDVVGYDGKHLTVAHRDAAACEDRTSNLVDWASRAFWIEPEGTKNIPGRRLSAIVVTGNPERAISIPHVQQLTDVLLRLPGLAGEVIQVWDVEARFVALRIQTHETGGVRKLPKEVKLRGAVLFDEELVQPSVEGAAAAHELNETLRIVLY